MKKIYLKFISDVTIFFILSVMSVAAIVWVIQAVNFLDFVSEDGHSFATYFNYTLLIFPKIIGKIYPFVFFLSLFFIIVRYENNNELIIFWTHGVTKKKLVNLVIKYSLIASLTLLILTTYIIPNSQDSARSHIRASGLDLFPSLIKEGNFNDTVSNLTVFVEEKNKYGELKNIFLKDSIMSVDNSKKNGFNIIFAETGYFKNDKQKNFLTLLDGTFLLSEDSKFTSFTFEKIDFDLSKYSTKTITYTKIQEVQSSYLFNCIYRLKTNAQSERRQAFIKFKDSFDRCNEKFIPEAVQELFERIIVAFYIPVLALISALLLLLSKDQLNYKRQKFIIFLFSLVTIVVHEISSQYFISNIITNILFLSLPFFMWLNIYFFINRKLKIN